MPREMLWETGECAPIAYTWACTQTTVRDRPTWWQRACGIKKMTYFLAAKLTAIRSGQTCIAKA
jgi:hypothetical protein